MIELRAGAAIRGTDGDLGVVDALVIDPTAAVVTHLVVSHDRLARRALVPLDHVRTASPDVVEVDLDDAGLRGCVLFDEPAFNVPGDDFDPLALGFEPGAYFLEPFASPLDGFAWADHERVPKGEITIRRGDEVATADGSVVGHVDEFLVDPTDGHVTHVVLRRGHLLRRHDDVVVPVGGSRFSEGRVVLGIDAAALERLEHIPVQRHGHVHQEHLSND